VKLRDKPTKKKKKKEWFSCFRKAYVLLFSKKKKGVSGARARMALLGCTLQISCAMAAQLRLQHAGMLWLYQGWLLYSPPYCFTAAFTAAVSAQHAGILWLY
jgi:hypothetical protein